MVENYFYYDPTSDCNTCISQYDYDRLSEKDKRKYKRMDIPITNLGDCKSIEEFTLQQVIDNQERVIKEQKEDIERLQAQLDREIHINRKMKKALEIYANTEPIEIMQQRWNGEPTTLGKTMLDIRKPAKDTLKQIEDME